MKRIVTRLLRLFHRTPPTLEDKIRNDLASDNVEETLIAQAIARAQRWTKWIDEDRCLVRVCAWARSEQRKANRARERDPWAKVGRRG